ncbi:hypothetical protein AN401_12750 [Zobellella denitrificans]|uniref:Uncharacterized protein n=1 Tax=Zobellella denitrificans TaxID=347534 RepID=A0A291HQW3_9GAMM|nr:hypothetical protein AN401_12750 [Zobellella denitrificans]
MIFCHWLRAFQPGYSQRSQKDQNEGSEQPVTTFDQYLGEVNKRDFIIAVVIGRKGLGKLGILRELLLVHVLLLKLM